MAYSSFILFVILGSRRQPSSSPAHHAQASRSLLLLPPPILKLPTPTTEQPATQSNNITNAIQDPRVILLLRRIALPARSQITAREQIAHLTANLRVPRLPRRPSQSLQANGKLMVILQVISRSREVARLQKSERKLFVCIQRENMAQTIQLEFPQY